MCWESRNASDRSCINGENAKGVTEREMPTGWFGIRETLVSRRWVVMGADRGPTSFAAERYSEFNEIKARFIRMMESSVMAG